MIKTLRPYQEEAVNRTIQWIKKNSEPCLLDLSVGAGKTVIIAKLAEIILSMAPQKKILVIAPNKELIEQNFIPQHNLLDTSISPRKLFRASETAHLEFSYSAHIQRISKVMNFHRNTLQLHLLYQY